MANEESYGEGWVHLNLMVNPETDEIHIVGGDREPGEGDTPYKGAPALERLKAVQTVLNLSGKVGDWIDGLARRLVETLDELEQLQERRKDAMRIIEKKRKTIVAYRVAIEEIRILMQDLRVGKFHHVGCSLVEGLGPTCDCDASKFKDILKRLDERLKG